MRAVAPATANEQDCIREADEWPDRSENTPKVVPVHREKVFERIKHELFASIETGQPLPGNSSRQWVVGITGG